MRVGVIGSGAISDIYLTNMSEKFDQLEVVAIASRHPENARKKAEQINSRLLEKLAGKDAENATDKGHAKHAPDTADKERAKHAPDMGRTEGAGFSEIKACTVDELLADESIDMVVNLTPAGVHYELIKAALLAGKHVYTEKTITDDVDKARELVAIAEEKGLYLGSAPDTFLGAALQTARGVVDAGTLGEIHSFVISANRNNDLLLSLFSFLREPGGGILYDYAVYYMTALVSLLGPVARVGGIVGRPYPQHKNIMPTSPLFGQMMDTPNESQVSAVVQLENGITGTLHMDADTNMRDESYFAIYGKNGILYLTDPNQFGGTVRFLPNALDPRTAPKAVELWNFSQYRENSRGIGPAEMADAIFEGRPCRASKEMAAHVLEVLSGILSGGEKGGFVDIVSTCELPKPLPQSTVGIRNIGHVSFQMKNEAEMLHFYRDVLGMREAFTLTLGDLMSGMDEEKQKQYEQQAAEADEEQIAKLKALKEHFKKMLAMGDKKWITYLKLADGQFLELFYDLGNISRTIENRQEGYGYTKLNYEVGDIEKLRDRLADAGIKIDMDVHTSLDGSREFTVHDPDGNEVQFTQYPDGAARILMEKEEGHEVCSQVSYTTQVAYNVQDELNMERFYCLGLGLKKVDTLTYGELAEAMAKAPNVDPQMLAGMRMMKDKPWLDFIEVAPHQYIELFHTAGRQLKEDKNLSDAYGYQHLCLEVKDIQAAYAAVKANGITPDTPISLGADGAYQFWLVDPDGNRLELMEYAPGAKQLR
jgi:predicted dehydrogenase/catechol 2,3-dioxygenase-like lactoylglutathione lyase family enzyme